MAAPAQRPRYRSAFGHGIRIGRVLGLDVVAHWSLLLIFALVAVNLGLGLFPQWHPGWSGVLTWSVAIGAAVLFFASIWLHEMSHALVARAFGMEVRGITLFVFGGVAQIAGEPPTALAEFLIAAIGPVTSVLIGVAATAAGMVLGAGQLQLAEGETITALADLGPVTTLLLWLGPVNIILGVFNMIPGFPLDGGRVLRAIVWGATHDLVRATRIATLAGQGFAWLLIISGALSVLGVPVPLVGGGLQGLWFVLIGWFLNNAARMSYQQLIIREALHGVPASRLMSSALPLIRPQVTLRKLDEQLSYSHARYVPVVSEAEERFVGMVRLDDVDKLTEADRDRITVEQVMIPAAQLFTMLPNDDAAQALERLTGDGDPIPVVDHGILRGMIRRRDLAEWLTARMQQAA